MSVYGRRAAQLAKTLFTPNAWKHFQCSTACQQNRRKQQYTENIQKPNPTMPLLSNERPTIALIQVQPAWWKLFGLHRTCWYFLHQQKTHSACTKRSDLLSGCALALQYYRRKCVAWPANMPDRFIAWKKWNYRARFRETTHRSSFSSV